MFILYACGNRGSTKLRVYCLKNFELYSNLILDAKVHYSGMVKSIIKKSNNSIEKFYLHLKNYYKFTLIHQNFEDVF